jgi:hypothetical protein
MTANISDVQQRTLEFVRNCKKIKKAMWDYVDKIESLRSSILEGGTEGSEKIPIPAGDLRDLVKRCDLLEALPPTTEQLLPEVRRHLDFLRANAAAREKTTQAESEKLSVQWNAQKKNVPREIVSRGKAASREAQMSFQYLQDLVEKTLTTLDQVELTERVKREFEEGSGEKSAPGSPPKRARTEEGGRAKEGAPGEQPAQKRARGLIEAAPQAPSTTPQVPPTQGQGTAAPRKRAREESPEGVELGPPTKRQAIEKDIITYRRDVRALKEKRRSFKNLPPETKPVVGRDIVTSASRIQRFLGDYARKNSQDLKECSLLRKVGKLDSELSDIITAQKEDNRALPPPVEEASDKIESKKTFDDLRREAEAAQAKVREAQDQIAITQAQAEAAQAKADAVQAEHQTGTKTLVESRREAEAAAQAQAKAAQAQANKAQAEAAQAQAGAAQAGHRTGVTTLDDLLREEEAVGRAQVAADRAQLAAAQAQLRADRAKDEAFQAKTSADAAKQLEILHASLTAQGGQATQHTVQATASLGLQATQVALAFLGSGLVSWQFLAKKAVELLWNPPDLGDIAVDVGTAAVFLAVTRPDRWDSVQRIAAGVAFPVAYVTLSTAIGPVGVAATTLAAGRFGHQIWNTVKSVGSLVSW